MIITNEIGLKEVVIKPNEAEKDIIDQMRYCALNNTKYFNGRYNVGKAGRSIGINRTTMSMWMRKKGICQPSDPNSLNRIEPPSNSLARRYAK